MSVDQRLRNGLARIAADVTAEPTSALRTVQRRARRQVRIVRAARVLAVAAALALGVLVAPPALDQVRRLTEPAVRPVGELEGTYVVDLADTAANRGAGVVGRWVVTLRSDGVVETTPPVTYPRARTGSTYRIEGDELRTDALVDSVGCQAAGAFVGRYRWARDDATLRFSLVSDACPARVALFSGQDWEVAS
jgi:hypothetical protein